MIPINRPDVPQFTLEEVRDRIRRAMAERAPFSVIRLGDGEGRIMGFPHDVPRPLVADIWYTWFGYTDFTDDRVASVRLMLKEACRHADLIGIPHAEPDAASDFGRVAALLHRDGFAEPATPVCHAGFHIWFQAKDWYRDLFAGLPRVGIIGPRDLTAAFPALYGVPEVEWLPVPPEMRFSDLPEGEKAGLVRADAHLAQRFPALMEREIPALLARHPGLVVLVGAGILGKLYCRRIKDLGGVAVDVGSMMDVWAGLKTRENVVFNGLRPPAD
ncbi:hypothetical protein [Azospirillum sp.]|uniref:GT-D fold domain-containing protein n=1 Tax=Azospirillum sp. TaxID=34012 RepID=UPI002D5125A1|nr:hypothetical protein [Azospirillum sp.]HYD70453.1 hypothetical protein [Azospirillum sp.]